MKLHFQPENKIVAKIKISEISRQTDNIALFFLKIP